MSDLDALDQIHDLLTQAQPDDEHPADVDGFTMTGAVVIGLYVRPDGYAATHRWSFGQMHHYALEGVIRNILRDIEASPNLADDDGA